MFNYHFMKQSSCQACKRRNRTVWQRKKTVLAGRFFRENQSDAQPVMQKPAQPAANVVVVPFLERPLRGGGLCAGI